MQKCKRCKVTKERSLFNKDSRQLSGLRGECSSCEKDRSRNNRRTVKGLVFQMYRNQKRRSVEKGFSEPEYSKEELLSFCIGDLGFVTLYDLWVESGFDRMKTPSIDRLDDYSGYSFRNIRVVDWSSNKESGSEDTRNGLNNKRSKTVHQKRLDGSLIKTFYSIQQIHASSISRVCNSEGGNSVAGGCLWSF